MNINKRQSILKGILGIVFTLAISMNIFAYIQLNGSGHVYCDDPSKPECSPTPGGFAIAEPMVPGLIDRSIEQGAAAYLNAYSAYLSFLNRVELSGENSLDYTESVKILEDSLQNIKSAKAAYYQLVAAAETTPYNRVVLAQLAAFDYDGYMKAQGLDSYIFKKVRAYLQPGNITGAYILTYTRVKEIESMLTSIKATLVLKITPALQDLWKVNELFAGTLLFGQYTARVFSEIK